MRRKDIATAPESVAGQDMTAVQDRTAKRKERSKNRIWELDFFRGLSILLVVCDHVLFDFAKVYADLWGSSGVRFLEFLHEVGMDYITSDIRLFWRPAFLFVFFFTSGLCTAFSRNNFLRGIKLGCVACAVTIITYFLDTYLLSNSFILFGVLHCMAVIILLYALTTVLTELSVRAVQKLRKKEYNRNAYKYVLSALCLALSVVFFIINEKFNVRFYDMLVDYQTVETNSKILGLFFYVKSWWTSDYFPLFPYIAFFFLGAGLTQLLYAKKKSLLPFLDGVWHQPFTVAGRHSLTIYVCCQIVAFGVLSLISFFATGSFI